jgi:GH24 family phage-related lysozyme (muramidase)
MSEKVHENNHSQLSGDLCAEGNQSAMPPAFSVSASAADPNLGSTAQRKSTATDEKKPTRLSSIKVPGVPQNIVNKIAASEEIRLDVYPDSEGLPTVGIGHLLSDAENKKWKVGHVLSEAEIIAFAKEDIGSAWDAAVGQVGQIKVSDPEFTMALFEVNFQLGEYWYTKHKKTWGYMKAGEWEKAALEAADSKWFKQTPKRVINFQKALRSLKGGGENKAKSGSFDLWSKIKSGSASKEGSGDFDFWGAAKNAAMGVKSQGKAGETASNEKEQKETAVESESLNLSATVGRGGKNLPADLHLLAGFLQKAGASPVLISEIMDPAKNGKVIERYQKDVLGFSKADGRIDPGGKTFKAISELKGRDIVAEWYTNDKPKEDQSEEEGVFDIISKWFGMGENEAGSSETDLGSFEKKELDVKKYWVTQTSGQCDVYTKKVITSHKKDNPELYKDFGGISSGLTAEKNSLHLAREDDWEKGTARTQGKAGGNDTSTLKKDEAEWDMGIRYINACLSAGVPAMIGVNHTFAYKKAAANNDNSTDHWLTIIGRGSDEKGKYFTYTDPGTKHKSVGTNTVGNRLYQTENPHIWRDDTKYANADSGKGSYTLVAVTLYDKHRGKSEFTVGNETFKRNKQF